MASINLILKRYQTARVKGHILHLERIVAILRIGGGRPAIIREAVVDTGAPLSVFPERQWRSFPREIRWLTKLHDAAVPNWCKQFGGAAGGMIPCRLGVLMVELFGANPNQKLGPAEILAMFAHDNGKMKDDILFGLGGGAFANRHFELTYDAERIVLSE
jgi:hypothetical protein